MAMRVYYVYVYYDPRKNPAEPIYVGKGKGRRLLHHTACARNPLLERKISHIRDAGLEPIVIKEHNDLDHADAVKIEIELIAKYGRADQGTGTLCNFTDGGEGTYGYKHKPETKLLFSQQRKGKKQTDAQYLANISRRHTKEARAKISNATKGHRWHTPEQIAKIKLHNSTRIISDDTRALWSQQRRGKKQTPEHIQKVIDARAAADAKRKSEMTSEQWEAYLRSKHENKRGQKRSEETRAKMREAWARRRRATKP
jgi:hypothetical protein